MITSPYPRKFVYRQYDDGVYWLCEAGSQWAYVYSEQGKSTARNTLETMIAVCQSAPSLYMEVPIDLDMLMDEGL
jgi:hypothetical protein